MKVQKEMIVHLYSHDKTRYELFRSDMSEYGHIPVCKQIIEFEVPDDFDPVPVQVAMLRKQEAKVREEFNERINQIKEEISKLSALTYSEAA